MTRLLFVINILLIIIASLSAQYIPSLEKGNPTARRQSNFDADSVLTTTFNFGFSGRTAAVPDEYPFEWPKNTDREYIAIKAMFIGGEVVDTNGDTIHIVDLPTYRQSPQGETWNFEPVPEYINPNQDEIARSDDPSSWPAIWIDKLGDPNDPGWPGSWNSFWGKDIFIADQEFYYHMSDDLYNRHPFYPDSTDSTRSGLGLVVSQREMVFNMFPDEVFFISDIYNVGDHDIEQAAVSFWIGEIVGGDASDDTIFYDLSKQIVYFCDSDGIGTPPFGNDTVGVAALVFIQTPFIDFPQNQTEVGISNIQQYPSYGINFSTVSDEFLWTKFMTPDSFFTPNLPGEYDSHIATSYFPLPSSQFQRLITAVTFGQDTAEINSKLDYIKTGFQGILGIQEVNNLPSEFALDQNYPNPFNPETTIRFQIRSTQNVSLVIYDILGRKVRNIIDQKMTPDLYTVKWDGKNEEGKSVTSGVYFYRLKLGNFKSSAGKVFVKTRKMLLIK